MSIFCFIKIDKYTTIMISSSYLELPRSGKFRGYVINVYDPVNYDIDIHFDPDTNNKYKDVFKSYYTCISLDSKDTENRLPLQRPAYRCRVKGISMERRDINEKTVRNATNDINKKIYLFNGWVDCYVNDIDYYNRILVELYDPITGESLTDDIFYQKYPELFSQYIRQNTNEIINPNLDNIEPI